MSTSLRLELVALASLALSAFGSFSPAIAAATFEQKEVDQSKFIAVASPYGNQAHQLLILEQVSSTRPCWQETGVNNAQVDPLLLKFDFTGICSRSTDSNGYSIRLAGQDLGLKYNLRVVKRNGELVLLGVPNRDPKAPTIEIGRSQLNSGFAKIVLNPGWRLTKRVYNGKALGHVYLTNDTALEQFQPTNVATSTPAPTTTKPSPAPVVSTPGSNSTGTAATPPRLPQVTVRPAQPQVISPAPTSGTSIPILVPPPEATSKPISTTRPVITPRPVLTTPPASPTRPAASSLPLPTLNPASALPPVGVNQPASRPLPPPPVVTPALTSVRPGVTVPTAPATKPQSPTGGFVVPTVEEGNQSSLNNSSNRADAPMNLPTVTVYR